jgi:hypothetical protein
MADLGEIAFRSIFMQDPAASFGSMTGSGERLDVQYRFRRDARGSARRSWRRRLGRRVERPGAVGAPAVRLAEVETSERTTGRVAWSDWTSGRFQVSARGGVDRWLDIGRARMVGGTAYATTLDDRISVGSTWIPGWARRNSAARRRSRNTARRTGAQGSWWLVGSGAGRRPAMACRWNRGSRRQRQRPSRPGAAARARTGAGQPLLPTDQMGRTIVHGSGEGQYWFASSRLRTAKPAEPEPADVKPTGVGGLAGPGGIAALRDSLRVGVAVFVDSARVMRRLSPGDRNDVDIGGGIRISLGGRGSIRADYGRGLLNVDNKFSFGYEL